MENAEILIVGGGVAGLATAYHLAQAGQRGVVLLEREDLPGFYASGHNAGIARQLTGRAEHTALAILGRNLLAEAGLLRPTGGFLLGADPGGARPQAREAAAFGLPHAMRAGSPFADLRAAEHLHLPTDGLIDTGALLQHCAAGARAGGARLHFGCQLQDLEPEAQGFMVHTDQGALRARTLVNAAGAWAGEVGRMAGGLPIAFTPLRRHLVWSSAPFPQARPYTWWTDRPLYLRPEAGGALLCACEEEAVAPPGRGFQPGADEGVLAGLGASLQALAPGLEALPVTRFWCGLRTFAPDRGFVLGPDPLSPDLFWVAGLGGHGMTTGLAVGALAARALLRGESTGPMNPGRLIQH